MFCKCCAAPEDKSAHIEEVSSVPAVEAAQKPVEAPAVEPGNKALKVKIAYARGLRNADWTSKSDPYCECEVVGKGSGKLTTAMVSDSLDPVWDFEGAVDCAEGDSLSFKVLDKDLVSSDSLGSITIPAAAFQEEGFDGEVLLEQGGSGLKPYLRVSITGPDGKTYPQGMAKSDEFTFSIKSKPLGLRMEKNGTIIRINQVLDTGAVPEYNKKAAPAYRVESGDYVSAVNGSFDYATIIKLVKEESKLDISVRKHVKETFEIETPLGVDLKYEKDAVDLSVKNIQPGKYAESSGKFKVFDHIIGVDSVQGPTTAARLSEELEKANRAPKTKLTISRLAPCPSSGPVDVSSITRMAKDDLGLLPQPEQPKANTAVVQIYVRSQPFGGSDKSISGHRYDSIPIANGMINAGMSCQLIHYVHEEHVQFMEVCKQFHALVVRCNPGQIKADGGDQTKFDTGMRELRKKGIQIWPSPDVMEQMGAKDALCKVAKLNIGLEDTLAYYTEAEFSAGFKKTMAFQPRVIKQNRGSSGEGIWIIKLKSGDYCKTYGERSCADDEVLEMMEANDNHAEEHTVAEFVEFCVNGRTDKSGNWTSKGTGKYLEGGKEAGGQLVDQRFCPRIVEGELRYNMAGDSLVGIIHKKPKEGGISAVSGTGSIYTFYGPDEPLFVNLTENFLKRDMAKIMPSLGLDEPIPLWWTTDFINASPPGTKAEDEKWIVGEFNCSCVGISKCLPAYCKTDTPTANFCDIPPEDRAEAKRLGDLMGQKALKILGK